MDEEITPTAGHWPVDPQEDVPVSKDRIWVDGCFDFSHHGTLVHALAVLVMLELMFCSQAMPELCFKPGG